MKNPYKFRSEFVHFILHGRNMFQESLFDDEKCQLRIVMFENKPRNTIKAKETEDWPKQHELWS